MDLISMYLLCHGAMQSRPIGLMSYVLTLFIKPKDELVIHLGKHLRGTRSQTKIV